MEKALPSYMSQQNDKNSAPNAPSLPAHILLTTLSILLFSLCLLPTILLTVIAHPFYPPHTTWSLRRHLLISIARLYFTFINRWSLPRPEGKAAWKGNGLLRWLAGRGKGGTKVLQVRVEENVVSELEGAVRNAVGVRGAESVKAEDVPGFWTVPAGKERWARGDEPARKGEKVIIYLAGGSWVMVHPQDVPFPYGVSLAASCRVFSINYRKALSPSTAWPAQLFDALAGYRYILALGFEPRNVGFMGDSSGAHLILALTRFVGEMTGKEGMQIGMPGAMFLISPTADISHPPRPSLRTDILCPHINQRALPSFARYVPKDEWCSNVYLCPGICGTFDYLLGEREGEASVDTHTTSYTVIGSVVPSTKAPSSQSSHSDNPAASIQPLVWIQYGTTEVPASSVRTCIDRMRAQGLVVEVDEVGGGVHDDAAMAWVLREGEGSSWGRLKSRVGRWVKGN